jgi:hypothetical protein
MPCKSNLSDEQRWAIVKAWQQSKNITATARTLRMSRSVVRRWVTRYNDTGSVACSPKSGRPAALKPAARERAVELLLSDEHGTADRAAQQLCSEGLTARIVHKTTLIRAAKALARSQGAPLKVARGAPAKMLNKTTKAKRLAFAQANKGRCWDNVACSDRKRFVFKHPGCKKQRRTVTVLADWPPSSPDLNPIENVWGYVQRKVDAQGCKSFEEFKQAVLKAVQEVPLKVLKRLFDSLPHRLSIVIEKQGGKTGY